MTFRWGPSVTDQCADPQTASYLTMWRWSKTIVAHPRSSSVVAPSSAADAFLSHWLAWESGHSINLAVHGKEALNAVLHAERFAYAIAQNAELQDP